MKIKIKFVDFWPSFNVNDNFLIDILKKNYDVEVTDYPDYLFFSVFGSEFLDYDCIRIFFTGENICPDFNVSDYAIGFEYLTYSDRYLRFPLFLVPPYLENLKIVNKREFNNLNLKTEFCSFVVSATNNANDFRLKLFHSLNEYKKVDSGGKYLNNVGGPVENKFDFELKHKFSICCENSSHPGYTTEKIVDAFASETIPIYWGDPNIEIEFNPDSFVNCNNFNSLEDIVNIIKKIDNNDEIYYSMLQEKAFLGNIEDYYGNLEFFLYNIFNQSYEKAFRRKTPVTKSYEAKLKILKRFYLDPKKCIVNVLNKLHLIN